ncbi:right-handed parallel beta-helix repeat-containing protein [Anaerofustis stercorihominis]|uniref:right-handed parallel beta-helix repeat-containing protein n=1 Tax=Anaerofustis stercorihominis TaxID=214853 RepID=UPI00214C4CA6|nr:right-handed parallel beta-helix repeat-containing protein [Anaerofustis stercorihominis]MCR2032268.1 right-handed parallel beta-helix repeat-containing protein [Anaerofustis stercorihominis]
MTKIKYIFIYSLIFIFIISNNIVFAANHQNAAVSDYEVKEEVNKSESQLNKDNSETKEDIKIIERKSKVRRIIDKKTPVDITLPDSITKNNYRTSSKNEVQGSTAKGANLRFTKVIQIDVTNVANPGDIADNTGVEDSRHAIQQALNDARDNTYNAPEGVYYQIIIPKGTYKISKALKIYSNTWLKAGGATIIRGTEETGPMLYNMDNGGYNGPNNIFVEGGTWDGNGNNAKVDGFSNMIFGHGKDIAIYGANIKNNKNGHHIEIGGCKNVIVKNCKFSGYYYGREKDSREAIQLDIINNSDIFPSSTTGKYDDTVCDNIVIIDNSFNSLSRGIGTHSAVIGKYMTNISICNNTFTNLKSMMVYGINYRNSSIQNNNATNVSSGIDIRNMTSNKGGVFYNPQNPTNSFPKNNSNINFVISGNSISTVKNGSASIILYGENVTYNINKSGKRIVPARNYYLTNFSVSNNNIKGVKSAIILNNAREGHIYNNQLTSSNDTLKLMYASNNIEVSKNNIYSINDDAVYISGGSKGINIKSNSLLKAPKGDIVDVTGNGSKVNIYNTKIYNAGLDGICIRDRASGYISGCKVYSNKKYGVNIYNKASFKSYNSRIYNNGLKTKKTGVRVDSASKLTSNKSTIYSNGTYGILLTNKSKLTSSSDKFKFNKYNGIHVSGKSSININNPTITGNKREGVHINYKSKATIVSGKIAGNKKGNVIVQNKKGKKKLSKPKSTKVKSVKRNRKKNPVLAWNRVSGINGYRIYRKKGSSWKGLKNISKNRNTTIDTKTKTKNYKYSIKTYKKYLGTTWWSSFDSKGKKCK